MAGKKLSLSAKILIGLLSGIAVGLFFGEYCAFLDIFGKVFVGLLQMTVLPYIVVSLVANIGNLRADESKRLFGRGALVLAGLWVIGLIPIALFSLSYPALQTASFFSTDLVEPGKEVDFLGIYIPTNVFASLSENAVPAVVLFCIAVGVALITIRDKKKLIDNLHVMADALAKVNSAVVKLTPYGVFAIAASAAGTMTIDELGRLQAYLITTSLATAALTFWVVPQIVAAVTPFTYRQVMRASKEPLITSFATGKVLVTLPMMIENLKTMYEELDLRDEEKDHTLEAVVPLAYPFPHIGKLMGLMFIPFAAWFVGQGIEAWEYPGFLLSGLVSYFGGPMIATPFLLEQYRVPADMFQLFLIPGVYTARIGDLLGAMHILAMAVVTTCAMSGALKMQWPRLFFIAVSTVVLFVVSIAGTHVYLAYTFEGSYNKNEIVARMHVQTNRADERVLDEASPNPDPIKPGQTALQRIRERGLVRIGYDPDRLPYTFFNAKDDLVGFDVDMAHRLAEQLRVKIEFVPFTRATLAEQLKADHFDVAMAGVVGTVALTEEVQVSDPYLHVNASFVVLDHRAKDFRSLESLLELERLRIGVQDESRIPTDPRKYIPQVEVVEVENYSEFFKGDLDLDALYMSAEAGSAWTLLYPQYTVIKPGERMASWPLVYPIAKRDESLEAFMDHWVKLKKLDGSIDEVYAYWILGRDADPKPPRWSVIRDVLGWVD